MNNKLPPAIAAKFKDLTVYPVAAPTSSVIMDANESFAAPEIDWAAVMASVKLNRYPDPTASKCCALASEIYNVPPSWIVAGNGSDELISLLLTIVMPHNSRVALAQPDFSMYRFYAEEAGHTIVPLKDAKTADVVIFSNPCNPTGQGIMAVDVERLVQSTDALVVVDEAYMDFWDQSVIQLIDKYDNLIVLKTCSKNFGLAAVRLGFALAQPHWIDLLKTVKSPYNVNALTQAVVEEILSKPHALTQMTAMILENKKLLTQSLIEILPLKNLTLIDTKTNFLLVKGKECQRLFAHLRDNGIAVRYFSPDLLRITVGSELENQKLINAIEAWEV